MPCSYDKEPRSGEHLTLRYFDVSGWSRSQADTGPVTGQGDERGEKNGQALRWPD